MRLALAALALLQAVTAAAAPHASTEPPASKGQGAATTAAPVAEAVVLFPSLGRPTQVTVAGRVLAAAPGGRARPAPRGLARAGVEVSLAGQVRRALSGPDGLFEVAFATPGDHPLPPGPLVSRASSGAASGEGLVQVVEDGAPFLVVIDADDLVGLATRGAGPGTEEATPPATAALLRCLVTGTRPQVGVLAVTAGGADWTTRLQGWLAGDGLPFIGLLARPAAPRGAGQEAALRAVLSTFPQQVLLLGDAAGRAPERFAALRAEFPGRVVATYLRGSATGASDRRFEEATLFTDPLRAARHAAGRGLADQACVERGLAAAPTGEQGSPGGPVRAELQPGPAATPAP